MDERSLFMIYISSRSYRIVSRSAESTEIPSPRGTNRNGCIEATQLIDHGIKSVTVEEYWSSAATRTQIGIVCLKTK